MSSGSKRKRQDLDLKTRCEVVRFKENNPHVSARKLADQFKCGKTQIQAILLKKDEILKDYESNLNVNIKRVRGPQHSLSIRPSYGARGEDILDGGGGRGRRERKA